MSKKHNHIERLTPELIKAYQEGNLSADEMYAVEKFLLENPFEAEALEGLEMLAENSLNTHMDDLNARLADQLAGNEETKVIFWTMTRKIAASLLVLVTAAFLFFWREPDITTKELTQAENKTEQAENEPALDTLQLRKDDSNEESLMAKSDTDEEKKEEDEKGLYTDSEDLNSGFIDANQLQVKSEPSPVLSLEAAQEEVARAELVEARNLTLASIIEAEELSGTEKQTLNPNSGAKGSSNTAIPQAAVLTAMDSLNIRKQAEAMDKVLQGRVAGVKAESQRALRTGFRSDNDTKADSAQANAFQQNLTRSEAKTKATLFTISGIVRDDQGDPLPEVSVQIKGTSIGMLTDAKGAYSLSSTVAIGSLLFRYLGYTTLEEVVGKREKIDVEMAPDVSSLGEVVVSDYAPPQPPDDDEVKNYNPARPIYGQRAFSKHVKENLIYPDAAAKEGIKGRVLVEFTVTAEGDLKDFKILKGLGYGCDEEAIRLVKTGPRWQARRTGIDRSTPVDSKVKVRIRFKP